MCHNREELIVIDIGSYSILASLFKKEEKDLKIIEEIVKVTELLERRDEGGYLSEKGVKRVIETLKEVKKRFRNLPYIAFGTQAFREAKNKESVISEIERKTSYKIEVISSEREARLSWLGAIYGIKVDLEKIIVIDIGGGSTELIIGDRSTKKIISFRSVPIGVAKLNYLSESQIYYYLKEILEELEKEGLKDVVFSGGTITTLASLILGGKDSYNGELIHGLRLDYKKLSYLYNYLLGLDQNTFLKFLGIFKDRSKVIKRGLWFILYLMEKLNLDSIIVSDRGTRWGVAIEYFKI